MMPPFDRVLRTMTNPWVMFSYLLLIILSFIYLDLPLAIYLHNLDLRHSLVWLNWVTKIGIGGIYIVLFFLLALAFRYIWPNKSRETKSWFLWFCIIIPSLFCCLVKIALGRARPALWFEENLYGFYWLKLNSTFWSFPSGHTTVIMGLVFGLSIIFPKRAYALILVGLLVASSRILLTHHYLSDVLMASWLALLVVALLRFYAKKQKLDVS